ncbi:MAG: hypothetical protein EON59_15410 [Alphaproteobacteria bacterium]|nr:MAG: hypothetical protein EON59_15410 [Alphaproteobacteria bacterium]
MPIWVVGADVNKAAQHNYDAIFGHTRLGTPRNMSWLTLNYEKAGKPGGTDKIGIQKRRKWYRNDPKCLGVVPDVTACDEYPHYASQQGGVYAVPRPSLRVIDAKDNGLEGSYFGARFVTRCAAGLHSGTSLPTQNATGGTRFLVLAMPRPGSSDPSPTVLGFKPPKLFSPVSFGICKRGTVESAS